MACHAQCRFPGHGLRLGFGLLLVSTGLLQAALSGSMTVRALQGNAFLSTNENRYTSLRPGTVLLPGHRVYTGAGAAVDIVVGKGAGILRLTEGTQVELLALQLDESFDVTLFKARLHQGSVLGIGQEPAPKQTYTLVYPHGQAQINATAFRLDARGYVVVLDGKVHLDPDQDGGTPTRLEAPPAVYYAPAVGVRPAPKALVTEVQNQISAPLGGRAPASEPRVPWYRRLFGRSKPAGKEPATQAPAPQPDDYPTAPAPSLQDKPRRKF